MKKKIYKIEFNNCDYDQYDAFIVRAENEEKVVEYIKTRHPVDKDWGDTDWSGGYIVTEVLLDGKTEEILGSFNAG